MPIKKLLTHKVILVGFSLCLSSCYVTSQAWHQNSLINSRRSVQAVIQDETTNAQIKKKLVFLGQILDFAQKQGLNSVGAYRYYVDTGNQAVSFLVEAAKADALESRTWWFPFVGRVPYLAFYNKQERDQEAIQLQTQGFDVYQGEVGAFSSLGWFDDPVFTSMLRRSDVDLAQMLFHELTHRTVWISGQAEFNENLAEFVGDRLVETFFIALARQGELQELQLEKNEKVIFNQWLESLKQALNENYQNGLISRDRKLAKKTRIFAEYLNEKYPKFKSPQFKRLSTIPWNNATVLAMSLYAPKVEEFEKAYQCSQAAQVGTFLRTLEKIVDKLGKPEVALVEMCATNNKRN